MSKKRPRFVPERPFVALPRSLLISPAWRALGINAHRLIEFLMIEHLNHGGEENGRLLAPRKQLADFGIGEHFISGAIAEATNRGLVDVIRGAGRAASRYALTWIPVAGTVEPTNRWRSYQPGDDDAT